jgi:hypothetical protein
MGDANGDGAVDGADFLIWQRDVAGAATTPVQAVVPEPSSLVLVLLSLAALRCRRAVRTW